MSTSDKDLEKFIKLLALKSAQIVVQSRLGEKMKTECNPLASGNDWFNIPIQDHPEVAADAKRALAFSPGESILQRFPLCIEISLKTVEDDQMVLEVWSLDLQTPASFRNDTIAKGGVSSTVSNGIAVGDQQTLKAAHAIYNRMGILLKSLLSLTRATPAYKLSRRQCADSYRIYYRIYVDRPQIHTLGEGYKHVRFGQLNTVVGILSMSVAYRTKMTITPTNTQQCNGKGNAIMLKSDHFRPADNSPTQQQQNAINAIKKGNGTYSNADRKIIDIEKPLRPGAFTDINKLRQYTEEDYVLPETPPLEWLLRRTRLESESSGGGGGGGGSIESLNRKCESPVMSPLSNGHQHNINLNNNNNNINIQNNNNINYNNNLATFKSFENDENIQKSPAYDSSTSPQSTTTTLSQSPIKSLLVPVPPTIRRCTAINNQPPDDDNLLKELNFPFASTTSHVNDLAKFYRDCYHAPPLRGLSEIQADVNSTSNGCGAAALAACSSSADSSLVDDLSRQLEQFETSLEDYDKLVLQLGITTASSSTGSRSSGGGLQLSN